jgi:uncharacterized protein YndB with AHSA1/START domain
VELNEFVRVRRPATVVFEAWSSIERAARYSAAVVERTKLTDGPVGRGTRFRAVDRWPGRLVTYTVEITAFERPGRIAATWSNPLSGGWDAIFEPLDDGTELRFFSCHRCEERWWNREGQQLDLRDVLDLARRAGS